MYLEIGLILAGVELLSRKIDSLYAKQDDISDISLLTGLVAQDPQKNEQ
jgi:hypothetical protein